MEELELLPDGNDLYVDHDKSNNPYQYGYGQAEDDGYVKDDDGNWIRPIICR